MKSDRVYLGHLLDAIAQIQEYTSGVSEEQFRRTRLLQDGVVRQLEIIGEASRHLSEPFREGHPEVPWQAIVGMRNRIAHDYLNVDLRIVWEVCEHDLPWLRDRIRAIRDEQGGSLDV